MEYHEYWSGVRSLVREIRDEYPDLDDAQDALWEWVDSHQWVIYNRYHLYILMHSDNDEAMVELGIDRPGSVAEFLQAAAFYAMHADVQEAFQELI